MGPKYIWVMTLTFLGHVTTIRIPMGHFVLVVPGTKSVSPAVFEILSHKHIGVTTLTFLDHVTSSVTWLFESQYVISYWCSIGSKCLSLTDSEILCPKPHVPIGRMLNRHCACAISRDMYPYVKFKCIFQFLAPTLPIHYATFIRLRWRIGDVLSVTYIGSNVKGQIEQKFSKSKNLPNFDLSGAWRSGGMKSSDFYHKRHILAWKHVVWAILRECPLRGLTPRAEIEKKSESHARLP